MIKVLNRAVMIKDKDTIVDRIKDCLQLVFLVSESDLDLFALGYILRCAVQFHNLAGNIY
jgi:hypothetical protein